jgi:hypothetical protein
MSLASAEKHNLLITRTTQASRTVVLLPAPRLAENPPSGAPVLSTHIAVPDKAVAASATKQVGTQRTLALLALIWTGFLLTQHCD